MGTRRCDVAAPGIERRCAEIEGRRIKKMSLAAVAVHTALVALVVVVGRV